MDITAVSAMDQQAQKVAGLKLVSAEKFSKAASKRLREARVQCKLGAWRIKMSKRNYANAKAAARKAKKLKGRKLREAQVATALQKKAEEEATLKWRKSSKDKAYAKVKKRKEEATLKASTAEKVSAQYKASKSKIISTKARIVEVKENKRKACHLVNKATNALEAAKRKAVESAQKKGIELGEKQAQRKERSEKALELQKKSLGTKAHQADMPLAATGTETKVNQTSASTATAKAQSPANGDRKSLIRTPLRSLVHAHQSIEHAPRHAPKPRGRISARPPNVPLDIPTPTHGDTDIVSLDATTEHTVGVLQTKKHPAMSSLKRAEQEAAVEINKAQESANKKLKKVEKKTYARVTRSYRSLVHARKDMTRAEGVHFEPPGKEKSHKLKRAKAMSKLTKTMFKAADITSNVVHPRLAEAPGRRKKPRHSHAANAGLATQHFPAEKRSSMSNKQAALNSPTTANEILRTQIKNLGGEELGLESSVETHPQHGTSRKVEKQAEQLLDILPSENALVMLEAPDGGAANAQLQGELAAIEQQGAMLSDREQKMTAPVHKEKPVNQKQLLTKAHSVLGLIPKAHSMLGEDRKMTAMPKDEFASSTPEKQHSHPHHNEFDIEAETVATEAKKIADMISPLADIEHNKIVSLLQVGATPTVQDQPHSVGGKAATAVLEKAEEQLLQPQKIEEVMDMMQHELQKMQAESGTGQWINTVEKLRMGVVQLRVVAEEFIWSKAYRTPLQETSFGSGWFIDNSEFSVDTHGDLLIVTNAHVAKQSNLISVLMPALGIEPIAAEVVGICVQRDIGLVKISNKDEFMKRYQERTGQSQVFFNKLGDSDKLKRGAEVMALGYPLGMNAVKAGKGVLSSYQEVRQLYLLVTAPINPGNSGGPLFNTDGLVVGINSAKFTQAARMAFAIPSAQVKVVLDALYMNRQWIVPDPGFVLSKGSRGLNEYFTGLPATGGVVVRKLTPKGLFEQAGVEPQDLLLAIDGYKIEADGKIHMKKLDNRVSISALLSRKKIGSLMNIHVYRQQEGKKGTLLKLSALYNQTPQPFVKEIYEPIVDKPRFQIVAGIVFMELSQNLVEEYINQNPDEMVPFMEEEAQFASQRLVVAHVIPDSLAGRDGSVKPGLLVESVNDRKVVNFESLCGALKSTGPFWSMRTGTTFTVLESEKVHKDMLEGEGESGKYGRASTGCPTVFKQAMSHMTPKSSSNTIHGKNTTTMVGTP